MASSIDIASNALVLIGDSPITSFDDSGAGAQTAKNLYPETYEALLGDHPWTFALKEQSLSKLTQTPDDETGYSNAFQVPVDCVRIWKIMNHSDYDIVGDLIYSNEDELICRYIYKVDESKLPSYFVKALEYKLAAEFAVAVTEDINKADFYERKHLSQLGKARTINSQGHPQVSIVDNPFIDVR
jgi:hypothetical protein